MPGLVSLRKVGPWAALLSTLTLASGRVEAEDVEAVWQPLFERSGVAVSARPRPGSEVRELRGIGIVDAPAERVFSVLADIERYPSFMPPTVAARQVHREGDSAWFYMEIDPPVIARRDYCIRVDLERAANGLLRSRFGPGDDHCPPPRPRIVRVHVVSGEWLLRALDPTHTEVSYRVHIEVGGSLPIWMVNRASAGEVPKIFGALRGAALLPRYAACAKGFGGCEGK